jgi:hypothetical protein
MDTKINGNWIPSQFIISHQLAFRVPVFQAVGDKVAKCDIAHLKEVKV